MLLQLIRDLLERPAEAKTPLKTSIDRNSPLPYYVQLKDALRAEIKSGEWKPGDRIPGEPELCRLFGVSRTVVRQALVEMAHEGLVVREKGKGTFVAEPKITSKSLVHSLIGFYQDMEARGLPLASQVLEQKIEPASPMVASYLKLEPMTPVIKIYRLRSVQDEAIILVTSYLPYEVCRELVQADLSDQSLYAFIENQCGLTIVRGRRRINAVIANEFEADLLGIEVGSALIRLESISYLSDGSPIEYFDGLFRGDRSRFEVDIVRFQGQGRLGEAMGLDREEAWPI